MISDPSSQSFDPSIINKARNDLIFNAQGPAIIVVCLVVIGFTASVYAQVSAFSLIIWAGLLISSYVSRYFLCVFYLKSPDAHQGEQTWQRRFTLATIISGVLWGSSFFVLSPNISDSQQLLLLLLVIFLSAATTVTHSAYKLASMGFSACCLIPATLSLYLYEQGEKHSLALIVLCFLVVMSFCSVYLEKVANRMFMLSYENAKMASDLKHKNTELGEQYSKLEETKKELSQANDSLQKLVTTDALTGLTNRRRFDALTQLKWQRCFDSNQPISLILVNIDYFKQFNDYYGHRKGDSCLLSIAAFLTGLPEINRQSDCIARYSGDEFAILLVDGDGIYAKRVAEYIRKGIELLRIPCSEMPGGSSPWVTVSIGAVTEIEYKNNSSEDLVELVDKAMHRAKRKGRNAVHFVSESDSDIGRAFSPS